MLYKGLAENILAGVGYIDTIRNDEILPPVGHPLIIASLKSLGFDGYRAALLLLILSFMLLYLATENLGLRWLFFTFLLFCYVQMLPPFHIWSIECTLLLSFSLHFYAITVFFRHQSLHTAGFVALTLLLTVIVRPILLPLTYLLAPFIVYCGIKGGLSKKVVIIPVISFFVVMHLISWCSHLLYNDGRLLTGTYSEIGLYSAWNRYIPLNKIYYSKRWNHLSPNIREVAVEPMKNLSGWEDRASALRAEVLSFIIEEPLKAFQGYFWRISKFTFAADSKLYSFLFYLWIVLSILFVFCCSNFTKREKAIGFLSLIGASYVILITAVFIYVGPRYYVTPSYFMLFSLAIMIGIFKCHDFNFLGQRLRQLNSLF